jgi:hypothetical protein
MSTRRKATVDAAQKAVPDSSRGVRKGTTSASPRHPCGEARLGSRSDRATEATLLQSSPERAAAEIDALVSTPPATACRKASPRMRPSSKRGTEFSTRRPLTRGPYSFRQSLHATCAAHHLKGGEPSRAEYRLRRRCTARCRTAQSRRHRVAPAAPVAASELSATTRRCGPGTRRSKAHENLASRGNASRLSSVSAPARGETAPSTRAKA